MLVQNLFHYFQKECTKLPLGVVLYLALECFIAECLLVFFAASVSLRGEGTHRNFPREESHQRVLGSGAQSSVDDSGVFTPASPNRNSLALDDTALGTAYPTVCEAKIHAGDIGLPLIEPITKHGTQELEVESRVFGNVWYADHFSFLESGSSTSSPFRSTPGTSSTSETRYVSSPGSDATGILLEGWSPDYLDDFLGGVQSSAHDISWDWDEFQIPPPASPKSFQDLDVVPVSGISSNTSICSTNRSSVRLSSSREVLVWKPCGVNEVLQG